MKEEKRLTKPTMQRALLVFVAVVIVISAVMLYHDYIRVRNEGMDYSKQNVRVYSDYDYSKSVLVISSSAATQYKGVEEANGIYSVLSNAGIGYAIEYMNDKEMADIDDHEDNFYEFIKESWPEEMPLCISVWSTRMTFFQISRLSFTASTI